MMLPGLVLALLIATPAWAVEVRFCWLGSTDYHFTGRMTFPDALARAPRITEADVTGFEIVGYRGRETIGSWSLDRLTPTTAWNLNYLPAEARFATGGMSGSENGQQWNANGSATDCGDPGFGFNAGGNAQDLCLNGRYVPESGIASDSPILVLSDGISTDCQNPPQISLSGG